MRDNERESLHVQCSQFKHSGGRELCMTTAQLNVEL